MTPPRVHLSIRNMLGLVLLTAIALKLIALPMRESNQKSACLENLKAIGLALHSYHAVYDCFPPAYLADDQGRPMHSWRVLLLPFAGEQALYREYRFDEPWDGPNNRLLLDRTPHGYACPADTHPAETNYLAISGSGAAFPGTKAVNQYEFTDGTSNTVIVAEVFNAHVPWTMPNDLILDRMSMRINDPGRIGVSGRHRDGPCVLFGDGSVRIITPAKFDRISEVFRSMFTISGGDGYTHCCEY